MDVGYGEHIWASPVNACVNGCLAWRLLFTTDGFPCQVYSQNIACRDLWAARMAWVDEDSIGSGNSGAYMAAVIEETCHVEHPATPGYLQLKGR